MEKLVTVATFDLASEAETMKLLLEEEGFEVFLADDNLVGMNWFVANAVGGIKLQVPAPKSELARKFVEQHQRARRDNPDRQKPPVTFQCEECGMELTLPGQRRGGVETCPHCHEYVDVPE